MRIGIISGYHPGFRFNSPINHKCYADNHKYYYINNFTPEANASGYFFKICTIIRYIDLFDWIFWIDDDAYFTNFDIKIENFIEMAGDSNLLICASPSTKKIFTKFSSGQFLLKNTNLSKIFLKEVLLTNMNAVKNFWRDDLGYYTGGDQEAMVYLSEVDGRFNSDFFMILDHYKFNNRDFEYNSRLEEHFLVHFTGTTKQQSHREFCERLGVNPWLIPEEAVGKLGLVNAGR